jgi:hypothetical protein
VLLRVEAPLGIVVVLSCFESSPFGRYACVDAVRVIFCRTLASLRVYISQTLFCLFFFLLPLAFRNALVFRLLHDC